MHVLIFFNRQQPETNYFNQIWLKFLLLVDSWSLVLLMIEKKIHPSLELYVNSPFPPLQRLGEKRIGIGRKIFEKFILRIFDFKMLFYSKIRMSLCLCLFLNKALKQIFAFKLFFPKNQKAIGTFKNENLGKKSLTTDKV